MVCVTFLVGKAALEQFFSEHFSFTVSVTVHPLLHTRDGEG